MCTKSVGIISRMPWLNYSFNIKHKGSRSAEIPRVTDHNLSISRITIEFENCNDILRRFSKYSTDASAVNITDWHNLYDKVHTSVSNITSNGSNKISTYHLDYLIRVLQNTAYVLNKMSKGSAPLDFFKAPIRLIVNNVVKHINGVNDTGLTRIIYASSKGNFLKHDFIDNSFLYLLENEVMQRLNNLQALHILKILHSASHIKYEMGSEDAHPFGNEFLKCLINRLTNNLSQIGTIDISNLTSIIYKHDFINKTISSKIIKALEKRLYALKSLDAILLSAVTLSMYCIINTKITTTILNRLEDFNMVFYMSEDSISVVQLKRDNAILFSSKLLEICLRHNTPEVYDSLPNRSKRLLKKIQDKIPRLYDPNDWWCGINYNSKFIREALDSIKYKSLNIIPHIHGPYIMDLCDPIHKIIIEFEEPWRYNNHNWSHFHLSHFYNMRSRHLMLEGFKFIKVPHIFLSYNKTQRTEFILQLLQNFVGDYHM